MRLAERMGRLGTETAFEVLARAKMLEREGREIIHLEIGEPDFDTPANIVKAGIEALQGGHTHYGPSPGVTEVRDRIAREISSTRGISVTGDNVVITPGAKPIMFFVILALVDEGDEVLYPNPGFPIYESMINFVGGVPVPMRLSVDRDFDVDVDEVAGQITPRTKLMIVNSPNNPCGSIVNKKTLESLADLAEADLSQANLKHADLSGADLRGANLDRALLAAAQLDPVELLSAAGRRTGRHWPTNLSGASLKGTDFSQTDFSSAVVANTTLPQKG